MDPQVVRLGLTMIAIGAGLGYPIGWYLGWRWIMAILLFGLAMMATISAYGLMQGGWTQVMTLSFAFVALMPALVGGLFGASVARWQRGGT